MPDSLSISVFAATLLTGYVLGSVPSAYVVARRRGVDIFAVGTGQAGATNVWRNVSTRLGALVFFLDLGKGGLAVYAGKMLGLEGAWLLLPAATAILGHWNSPFTGFRGGDGLSTMVGAVIGLIGFGIVIPGCVAALIAIGWNSRFAHPTIWGGIGGYIALLAVAQTPPFAIEPGIILGISGLAFVVLAHSVYFHRRIRAGRRAPIVVDSPAGPEPRSQGSA